MPTPSKVRGAFLALRTHALPSAVWHIPTHLLAFIPSLWCRDISSSHGAKLLPMPFAAVLRPDILTSAFTPQSLTSWYMSASVLFLICALSVTCKNACGILVSVSYILKMSYRSPASFFLCKGSASAIWQVPVQSPYYRTFFKIFWTSLKHLLPS